MSTRQSLLLNAGIFTNWNFLTYYQVSQHGEERKKGNKKVRYNSENMLETEFRLSSFQSHTQDKGAYLPRSVLRRPPFKAITTTTKVWRIIFGSCWLQEASSEHSKAFALKIFSTWLPSVDFEGVWCTRHVRSDSENQSFWIFRTVFCSQQVSKHTFMEYGGSPTYLNDWGHNM